MKRDLGCHLFSQHELAAQFAFRKKVFLFREIYLCWGSSEADISWISPCADETDRRGGGEAKKQQCQRYVYKIHLLSSCFLLPKVNLFSFFKIYITILGGNVSCTFPKHCQFPYQTMTRGKKKVRIHLCDDKCVLAPRGGGRGGGGTCSSHMSSPAPRNNERVGRKSISGISEKREKRRKSLAEIKCQRQSLLSATPLAPSPNLTYDDRILRIKEGNGELEENEGLYFECSASRTNSIKFSASRCRGSWL